MLAEFTYRLTRNLDSNLKILHVVIVILLQIHQTSFVKNVVLVFRVELNDDAQYWKIEPLLVVI